MSKSKVKEIKLGKRGYKAIVKNKKLNLGQGKLLYEVIELSGPKMDKTRIFVDEASVRKFVAEMENEHKHIKLETSLLNKGTKTLKKEELAAKELAELIPELEAIVPAAIRDEQAMRPEDTDK